VRAHPLCISALPLNLSSLAYCVQLLRELTLVAHTRLPASRRCLPALVVCLTLAVAHHHCVWPIRRPAVLQMTSRYMDRRQQSRSWGPPFNHLSALCHRTCPSRAADSVRQILHLSHKGLVGDERAQLHRQTVSPHQHNELPLTNSPNHVVLSSIITILQPRTR